MLYFPRRIVDLAISPIRIGMWAWERYELRQRYDRAFSFAGGEGGLYPVARIESGFGASAGARLVHRDLFGNGGRLSALGTYGGRAGRQVSVTADGGWIARSRLRFGVVAGYRDVPVDRFFGIGDADLDRPPALPGRIDARARDVAIGTRFRHEISRGGVFAALRIADPVQAELSSTFTRRVFGPSGQRTGEPDLVDVFAAASLVGYETGLANVYTQLRLTVDSRRHGRIPALTTGGWWLAMYGGWAEGLRTDPTHFGRVGLDVQRFVSLWAPHRILRLRAATDAALAPLAQISFVDLPSLGGPYFLRGYARDRFRDRIAAFASAEYTWEINDFLAGFVFVEPGRVWSGEGDVRPWKLRMGYGGGLQLHSYSAFIARLQIASSLDGGVFVHLNFLPGSRPWARR